MDATSMKEHGYSTLYLARAIVILRSSNGWRSTSRTLRDSSGISSRKRTPLCARLISPGCGLLPPPTNATCEMVWWGARKGRWLIRLVSRLIFPATLCIWVVSKLSDSDNGGRIEGSRLANMDLPLPGGPIIIKL